MPTNLAARRSSPDVHEDLWATTKAMYAALVGGRDQEFEHLLNARERLLLETDARRPDADPLDAARVLDLATKSSELTETMLRMLQAARATAGEQLEAVRRGATASRGYGAKRRGTGAITNLGG
jgi:hypothetical protein